MSPQDVLLARGRELLRQARSRGRGWEGLPPVPADSGARDANELDRMQLACALQYHFDEASPADAELVRRLLEQEISWRRVDPQQGVGETLEICCWLVARAGHPQDVWLLARAKTANFDTACGLSRELLFCGGVTETLDHVRQSHRPERAAVLAELVDEDDEPLVAEADLASWRQAQVQGQPATPQDEPLACWISRALTLGHRREAKELVAQWAKDRVRDGDFFAEYAGYLQDLGDFAAEADARGVLLAHLTDAFERAGALGRAAAAERRAQRWTRALAHLGHTALLHRNHRQWRELGLGRGLVQEAFDLAACAPPPVDAQAFALAEEFAAATPRLPPAALEAAVATAQRLAAPGRELHYQRLLEASRAGGQ